MEVSVVALEQSESAWLPSVRLNYPITQWLRRLHKFRIQSSNNESHRVLDADNSGEYTRPKPAL